VISKKTIRYIAASIVVLCGFACASNKQGGKVDTQTGKSEILGSTSFPSGQPTSGELFPLNEISDDKTYAYTEGNPVNVGLNINEGALNERRFLNALAGPNGEAITYVRVGSCCPFKTKNATLGGMGLLDKYKVEWRGQKDPIYLYLNLYDSGPMKAPSGMTIKK
jgi:hypothetical protein